MHELFHGFGFLGLLLAAGEGLVCDECLGEGRPG
jgi:hypothetical protein